MSAQTNYVQVKIPIENADIVFNALCWKYGMDGEVYDQDGNVVPYDKESRARQALINIMTNAVSEFNVFNATQKALAETPDLNIQ